MKRILVFIAMISVLLVPALLAQGKGIMPIIPGSDKLKITGGILFMQTEYLSIGVKLTYMGRPVLNAKVWLNKWPLEDRGGGDFRLVIRPYTARVGNKLELAVELPPVHRPLGEPPFVGKKVLASLVINNIVEWVFPTPGQVIDLSSYSTGFVSCRWNFTGTPVKVIFELFNTADPHRVIFGQTIEAEAINVPLGVLTPGNEYRLTVDDGVSGFPPMGAFTMSKLTAPGSSLVYQFSTECTFSTMPAK
jgi:hypothetical protein